MTSAASHIFVLKMAKKTELTLQESSRPSIGRSSLNRVGLTINAPLPVYPLNGHLRPVQLARFVPNSEVVASFDHLVSAAGCCAASAAKIESSSSGDFNGNGSTVIPIALAADPRWARKGGLVGFNGLNNVAMVFAFGRTSCWISSIAVQEAAKVGGL